MTEVSREIDRIGVSTTYAATGDVAVALEIGHDLLHGTFAYTDLGGYVVHQNLGVSCDLE